MDGNSSDERCLKVSFWITIHDMPLLLILVSPNKTSQESVVRSQCDSVISQMKEELLRYAENANRQALDFVEKAVSQSKENTAAKYKKYHQR